MQPNSQQVILLGVLGLCLASGILVYMFIMVFGDPNDTQVHDLAPATPKTDVALPAVVPDSSEATEVTWQQEFVAYETDESDAMNSATTGTSANSELSTGALSEESIGFQVTPPRIRYTEPAQTATNNEAMQPPARLSDPVEMQEDLPSIALGASVLCGEVAIPDSTFGIFSFINTAGTNPAVVCLGEAIGAGCEAAHLKTDDTSGDFALYVTSRADSSSCRLGITSGRDKVMLCDLVTMVAQAGGGVKDWDTVQAEFAANPGAMMSLVIGGNFWKIQSGDIAALNCDEYLVL